LSTGLQGRDPTVTDLSLDTLFASNMIQFPCERA
jgi:hypothetical protein